MINFCYDHLIQEQIGHPNLALWKSDPFTPGWREFDKHWPRTIPLRLLLYFDHAGIPYTVSTVIDAAPGSFYPIGISWFDFSFNYISNLSIDVVKRLKEGSIKLLFYYHEGDNPKRIKSHLSVLCMQADLKPNCYVLISANSAADDLENCVYFPDHEYFFRVVNKDQLIPDIPVKREYTFTMLNRTHKWWRASCTADLLHQGILSNSLWSYNTNCNIDDDPADNPLELYLDPGWDRRVHDFYSAGPYKCDNLSLNEQNSHYHVNIELYHKSYFHIISETHFDADQSLGTFITEKTFKPIKFGQPFVVVGTVGTLDALRNMGYRVFDDVLDNSYDSIEHNTQRWFAIRKLLNYIHVNNADKLFERCLTDILWNQKMFLKRAVEPVNTLLEKLTCRM